MNRLENAISNLQSRVGSPEPDSEALAADTNGVDPSSASGVTIRFTQAQMHRDDMKETGRLSEAPLPKPSQPLTGHRGYVDQPRGRPVEIKVDTSEARASMTPPRAPRAQATPLVMRAAMATQAMLLKQRPRWYCSRDMSTANDRCFDPRSRSSRPWVFPFNTFASRWVTPQIKVKRLPVARVNTGQAHIELLAAP